MSSYDEDIPFTGEYLDFAHKTTDELQTRIFELLTLVETSRELLRAQDADDVARRVLLSVIGVLGASSAAVLRCDPDGERMELLVHSGLDIDEGVDIPLPEAMAEAFSQEASPRPFRVDEDLVRGPARSFVRAYADILEQLEAAVVCPLTGRKGLFGFLILGRRLLSEGYSASDLEIFASLADLYVLALERGVGPAPLLHHAHETAEETVQALVELRNGHPPLREIMGGSEQVLQLFRDMVQLANSRATVLIQGESGTGKELVARAIHELSPRREGPMEVVDCSSIPRELIESELFGHVRGAFTGAVRDRRGAFELAHRGTLFLDEIGDMTLASQTRLLRALQEGKFRPVGGEKTQAVDVRVIVASNVDLREAVQRGEFRKDLFYRVQVFPLRLPPLREREGDIEILTRAFLKRFYADFGLEDPPIENDVMVALRRHPFPGNVRELQNMVEAVAIRSRSDRRVEMRHLNEVFRSQRLIDEPELETAGGPGLLGGSASTPRGSGGGSGRSGADGLGATGLGEGGESEEGLLDRPGSQVLIAWREAGFNLLEASRRLKARRTEGDEVLVADRAQMNHYLDGETLAAFAREGSFSAAASSLAADGRPRHRATLRVRRVLQSALAAMETGSIHQAFPRLPGEYQEVLDSLERRGSRWMREQMAS